jgi:hypothetical protein
MSKAQPVITAVVLEGRSNLSHRRKSCRCSSYLD